MPQNDDFPDGFLDSRLMMSQSARNRWNREHRERAESILADLQSGLMARILMRAARDALVDLNDGNSLSRWQRELINTLTDLKEDAMLNQATHSAPDTLMTHEHEHAAHGAPDAIDGIHSHPHVHSAGESHHDHGHDQGPGLNPGRVGQSGQNGMYGAEMSTTSPLERHQLRNARLREHEERR